MQVFDMKKIYNAGALCIMLGLCAQPVPAAELQAQSYGVSGRSVTGLPSGTPMQGGLPASAQNGMNVVSQSTPGSYPMFDGSLPYREKRATATVMDAPPAWLRHRGCFSIWLSTRLFSVARFGWTVSSEDGMKISKEENAYPIFESIIPK